MITNTTVLLPDAKDLRSADIDARLMQDRIVFLGDQVNAETAGELVRKLIWLEKQDNATPITLYINSPGGSVIDGMAIYDTIRRIKPPVHAIVAGMAASMGAVILSGCEKGERSCLRHAEVLLHQPLGGAVPQHRLRRAVLRNLLPDVEDFLSILRAVVHVRIIDQRGEIIFLPASAQPLEVDQPALVVAN
jgi:ATP-dependent Clp protease protease subunit